MSPLIIPIEDCSIRENIPSLWLRKKESATCICRHCEVFNAKASHSQPARRQCLWRPLLGDLILTNKKGHPDDAVLCVIQELP